jgi:hypothetical protein
LGIGGFNWVFRAHQNIFFATIDVEHVVDLAPLFKKPVYNVIIPFLYTLSLEWWFTSLFIRNGITNDFRRLDQHFLYFSHRDHLPCGLDQYCILGTRSISMIKKTTNTYTMPCVLHLFYFNVA